MIAIFNGLDIDYKTRYYVFNHYHMAIQAAESGMGCLGRKTLIQPQLQSGQLIALSTVPVPLV